jgi:hypothetical protein
MSLPPYELVKKEVKTTRRTIITVVIIGLLALSTVSVASASPAARTQTNAAALTKLPIRIDPVTGADTGFIIIDTHTGWFMCIAKGGLTSGATYILQYHKTPGTGAAAIGSGVASSEGTVLIVGKLDASKLSLIQSPGNFLIGTHEI